MKYLIPVIALCLCSGCATRKAGKSESVVAIPGTTLPRKSMPPVRTPETVKAYPVGRYTDPNYPEEMHERHTVYRREQSPDWNYLPDPPYSLPLGPVVATSNPSPSYYVKTESEQMTAQQRAYGEALQEQNRALQKRIEAMQQEASKIPSLEKEVERMKKQLEAIPSQPAAPAQPEPAQSTPEGDDIFSSVEPPLPAADEFPSDESQEFLIFQMRSNEELAALLNALERRKISAVFSTPFLRRKELAVLNQYPQ